MVAPCSLGESVAQFGVQPDRLYVGGGRAERRPPSAATQGFVDVVPCLGLFGELFDQIISDRHPARRLAVSPLRPRPAVLPGPGASRRHSTHQPRPRQKASPRRPDRSWPRVAVEEEPRALIGDAKHPVELVGAHTLLGRAEQVEGQKPLVKRDIAIVSRTWVDQSGSPARPSVPRERLGRPRGLGGADRRGRLCGPSGERIAPTA